MHRRPTSGRQTLLPVLLRWKKGKKDEEEAADKIGEALVEALAHGMRQVRLSLYLLVTSIHPTFTASLGELFAKHSSWVALTMRLPSWQHARASLSPPSLPPHAAFLGDLFPTVPN